MKIEIWSDIVCPWCYIGKRRLEAALANFGEPVELVFRSFELDPSAPAVADKPLAEGLAAKYRMTLGRAHQMLEQMTQTAAEEGLTFDFARAKGGNTFDAHRVLHLARARGVQGELKERLMRAYFCEGRAISDHGELIKLGVEAGLDGQEVAGVLQSYDYADDVRADERDARALGVTGVPFFLIDGQLAVGGAQPPEVLLGALQKRRADTSPIGGPACDDGVCDLPE